MKNIILQKSIRVADIFFNNILVVPLALLPMFLRDFLLFNAERFHSACRSAKYFWPKKTIQRVSGVEFKLWVIGRNIAQQVTYINSQRNDPYEILMVELLREALKKSKSPVFMDLGACMGYYSCFVSGLTQDKFPVYALDSNPDYCKMIERSAKENGFKKIKVFPAVLSDKEELLSVNNETVRAAELPGEKIMSVTLDSLCINNGIKPDIVKVDVRGAEGKVFAGAREILKNHIKYLFFELHPDDYLAISSGGYSREQIVTMLKEAGFTCFLVGGFRNKRSPERNRFNKSGRINCIRIREQNNKYLFFDRASDVFILGLKDPDNFGLENLDIIE
jgi:FkbM family methyltransferase